MSVFSMAGEHWSAVFTWHCTSAVWVRSSQRLPTNRHSTQSSLCQAQQTGKLSFSFYLIIFSE